jgi:transcriptional regulator with XRE-family HTH domain
MKGIITEIILLIECVQIEEVQVKPRLAKLRAQQNLSQIQLADLLGTTKLTVSRWERGVMSPRRYFIERLCRVFECEESALGFSHETETLASQEQVGVLSDSALPLLEIPLVGRENELSRLQERLCMTEEQVALVAIHGLPGVGKTHLASTLAHSQEMREYFSDGILWTALGPTPNLPELLCRWGTLLGLRAATLSALSIQQMCQALHAAIGMRSLLLVVDDLWQLEDMHILLSVGGPNCSFLITTRFPTLAADVDACPLWLLELGIEQSLQVLSVFAPSVIEHEERSVRSLAAAVGGLPLALTLLGNYLRKESYQVPARRAVAALERLGSARERLAVSEPSLRGNVHPSHSNNGVISLQSSIEASFRILSTLARECLYALSVFSTESEGFSEDAALAVVGCSTRELDELLDAGLLEYQESGQYRLHPVISDYAKLHLDEQTEQCVRERLLAYEMRPQEDGGTTEEMVVEAPVSVNEHARFRCRRPTARREQIRLVHRPSIKSLILLRHYRQKMQFVAQLEKRVPFQKKWVTEPVQEQLGRVLAQRGVERHAGVYSALASFLRVWGGNSPEMIEALSNEEISVDHLAKPPP